MRQGRKFNQIFSLLKHVIIREVALNNENYNIFKTLNF